MKITHDVMAAFVLNNMQHIDQAKLHYHALSTNGLDKILTSS